MRAAAAPSADTEAISAAIDQLPVPFLPFFPERRLVPWWRCALDPGSAHWYRPLICHSLTVKGQTVKRPVTRAVRDGFPGSSWMSCH